MINTFGNTFVSTFGNVFSRSFLPSDLANLEVWYRKGIGVTVTGQGVSKWEDQSGNGRDLLQTTDLDRPDFSDATILFDGISEFLIAAPFAVVQPVTLYLRAKQVIWTNLHRFCDGNTPFRVSILQAGNSPEIAINAGADSDKNGDLPLNTFASIAAIANDGGSLTQVGFNAPVGGNAQFQDLDGLTLGAEGGGGQRWGNVQIKEFMIYRAAHDAVTRAQVITYLNTL